MNDVAAHAGVSLKTVSRVVNGDAAVIEETRTRVQRSIEQLGFRRNDSARQLRTGRTAGIGLILEDVADPFYSTLTRAVEQVAAEHAPENAQKKLPERSLVRGVLACVEPDQNGPTIVRVGPGPVGLL